MKRKYLNRLKLLQAKKNPLKAKFYSEVILLFNS